MRLDERRRGGFVPGSNALKGGGNPRESGLFPTETGGMSTMIAHIILSLAITIMLGAVFTALADGAGPGREL